MSMAGPPPPVPPLGGGATPSPWQRAYDSLPDDTKSLLQPARTHRRDILSAVLREAEAKHLICLQKRWKFKNPLTGETIIVRDVLEKIVFWVNRFKEVGDVAVQFDTSNASLPWAAVRFLLQVTVSDVQVFCETVNDLEVVSRLITRCGELERLYPSGNSSDLQSVLQTTLARLYAEVLTYLAHAIKFFGEKTLIRATKSILRSTGTSNIPEILALESEIFNTTQLLNAETLSFLRLSLSDQTSATTQQLAADKHRELLRWLSPSPYSDHHAFISESRHSPDVGAWLRAHKTFADWQTSSSSSILLLHGIAGSGKTTLFSTVVDSLIEKYRRDPNMSPFAYFYCIDTEFEKDRTSADSIMRTILTQLCIDRVDSAKARQLLVSDYDRKLASSRPPEGTDRCPKLRTRDCTRLILELADLEPLTIIIDSIESCAETEQHALIDALNHVVSSANNVVKVLVTSRTGGRASAVLDASKHIRITSQETRCDMETFVHQEIENAVKKRRLLGGNVSHELRTAVTKALLDGAGEMFLWVRLQLDCLCQASIPDDVLTALESGLPEYLERLYDGILARIFAYHPKARKIAIEVFSWVLGLQEPLAPQALLAIINASNGSVLEMDQLLDTCANLIVLDGNCNVIRFLHSSFQEFIRSNASFASHGTDTHLAKCCLEASSRGPQPGIALQWPSDDFYVYAAIYWPVHSKLALDANDDIAARVLDFVFEGDLGQSLSFDVWLDTIKQIGNLVPIDHAMKTRLDAIPNSDSAVIFLASIFGIDMLLEGVSAGPSEVNKRNDYNHTPIYLAASCGHFSTVVNLIGCGAEVSVESGRLGSPLHAACFHGHTDVAEELLGRGADPRCGNIFDDMLQAAFAGGREQTALFLIEHGAMIASPVDHEKAIQGAAQAGFVSAARRLQQPPFDAFNDVAPDKRLVRVTKAIEGGQIGVLNHFLSKAADPTLVLPHDAVAVAALHGHSDLVELLLDKGMNIEAPGMFGTPLRAASLANSRQAVQVLLSRGADIDACGTMGDALHIAATKGYSSIVKLLIDNGANVNQKTGLYGTALQAAAFGGHLAVVKLLVDAGADIHAKGYARDAFCASIKGGHTEITGYLLSKRSRLLPDRVLTYNNHINVTSWNADHMEMCHMGAVAQANQPWSSIW